jgi:hypothetical protein
MVSTKLELVMSQTNHSIFCINSQKFLSRMTQMDEFHEWFYKLKNSCYSFIRAIRDLNP